MKLVFWLIVAAILGSIAYVRFAPSDPAVWNTDPQVLSSQDLRDGVRRRFEGNDATMAVLERIILSTPRTEKLAGSIEEGRVTYVTRSKWMGFPDYTTVQRHEDVIELYARLRFGRSDLGVNKARVDGWLTDLGLQTGG